MKNIFLSICKKAGILLIPCLSVATLFACVDKSGESDLNPVPPTNLADGSDGVDNSGGNSGGTGFPIFEGGGVLAFPYAEGYGRNATGGRGGEIYHVTNLNDSGEGSFRDAVSKSYRVIVFDVSGIIKLSSSPIVLKSNQTILGHTAPGDGVVLYGGRISASGASNLIVRYLRVRMGAAFSGDSDAMGIANGSNMIFDHCSITWGKDENFSINPDGKGTRPKDITIQNSIIGQGLQNHSCGGLIQTNTDEGITIYRNLYIDNKTRNPKVKGLNQFVNNVVYNWGSGAAYNMGGDSSGSSETAIEDNYFIVGLCNNWQNVAQVDGSIKVENVPMNPARPFTGGNADFSTYCVGNYYDKDKDGVLNGVEITEANWAEHCSGAPNFLAARASAHPVIKEHMNATDAYNWIVKSVGAVLPVRDEVDAFLIDELTSLGTKGTIIQKETDKTQFPLGGPGTIKTGTKLLDTDNDGMPDVFEDTWGLDKNDPSDALKKASNGWTNLENYAFSLEYPAKYVK
ncbi:pectate lyase family protein [Bacteroides reticulotermitis]|uniref:Pectate lyase domain-containing protein n=2 Tax=Bacteroides reticulotermitis TaxID=1133319 RepID=W4UWC4_9BACE|nr:pectate lyase [Bacteroides reticulotermitis]MBB4044275.1 pectate lyase [Bacteroides reticulotermitis]GAE84814.1 hypothetical protein JCM10512_3185 [Bacteroides reticulotermitis JCM 10512]HJD76538.1 pectate lyase [Bacteroides reticulotermitis]